MIHGYSCFVNLKRMLPNDTILFFINYLEAGNYCASVHTFIYLSMTHHRNNQTYLQDFIVILKRTLQNYYKILKICSIDSLYIVMYRTFSNTQLKNGVLPIAIGFRLPTFSLLTYIYVSII